MPPFRFHETITVLSAGFRKRRRRKDEERKGQEPPGHRGQGGDSNWIGREEDRNRDRIQDRLRKDYGLKGGEETLLRGVNDHQF